MFKTWDLKSAHLKSEDSKSAFMYREPAHTQCFMGVVYKVYPRFHANNQFAWHNVLSYIEKSERNRSILLQSGYYTDIIWGAFQSFSSRSRQHKELVHQFFNKWPCKYEISASTSYLTVSYTHVTLIILIIAASFESATNSPAAVTPIMAASDSWTPSGDRNLMNRSFAGLPSVNQWHQQQVRFNRET